jgi:hypothetical protein
MRRPPRVGWCEDSIDQNGRGILRSRQAWPCGSAPISSLARQPSRDRPQLGQHLGLFERELRSLLLLVERAAVLAQDPLDQDAEPGSSVLADSSVDGDVGPDLLGQLARYSQYLGVAEDRDGEVVGLEAFVDGELVLGQAGQSTNRSQRSTSRALLIETKVPVVRGEVSDPGARVGDNTLGRHGKERFRAPRRGARRRPRSGGRELGGKNVPHQPVIHVGVAVDEGIAEGNDAPPVADPCGNLGVTLRQLRERLANDLELAFNRGSQHGVVQVVRE